MAPAIAQWFEHLIKLRRKACGGLTASGGQATEAQQMLAAALGKALEMGPLGEASQSASPAPHGTPAVHRVD